MADYWILEKIRRFFIAILEGIRYAEGIV